MRSPEELAATRAQIAQRVALAERVAVLRAALAQDAAHGGTGVVFRCDRDHESKQPRVAMAVPVSANLLLFVSRIAWRPGDALTLPPWMREHFLGVGLGEAHRLAMCASGHESDRALTAWLDRLDDWEKGADLPPGRERWLPKADMFEVATLVTWEADPAIRPWMRCQDHPMHFRAATRHELFGALRA